MDSFILTQDHGAVRVITLNRPDMLNAWHRPMRDELVAALEAAGAASEVGAIVLTGAGDRAFGAGQDLSETQAFDAERAVDWMGEWERLYGAIRNLDKPIIAALNGVAAGSAFQVALLADLRIAHPGVRVGQPEINSGIPSVTGPWLMLDRIGLARTIDLTLTGRMLDAEEALAFGLVSRVVPADQVLPSAMTLAAELASKPPVAMKLNKQRFRELTEASFRECLAAGAEAQKAAYGSGEPAIMMERFFAERAARKRG